MFTSQNLHWVGNSSEEDKPNYFLTGTANTSWSLHHICLVLVEISCPCWCPCDVLQLSFHVFTEALKREFKKWEIEASLKGAHGQVWVGKIQSCKPAAELSTNCFLAIYSQVKHGLWERTAVGDTINPLACCCPVVALDFIKWTVSDVDWSFPLKVLKLSTVLMLPSICLSKYFEKHGFKLWSVHAGYLVCSTVEVHSWC